MKNILYRIEYLNHPVLGNLEIDFCDENNNPYSTIVFVGNNGAGKSQILNSIYELLSGKLKYECNFKCWNNNKINNYKARKYQNNADVICIKNVNTQESFIVSEENIRKIGSSCIFSDVGISYTTNQIFNVSSNTLDSNPKSKKSNQNTSHSIKQLLIDIHYQDASEISTYTFENINGNEYVKVPKSIINTRMNRFNNAFSKIFKSLQYYKVEANNDAQQVLFKKNDKVIQLENLSSGEKQIVFRGAFFLRDRDLVNGSTFIIDEPEISMHPTWQENILNFYQEIASENHEQTSQIFVATHSDYVVKSAINNNCKIISVNNDDDIINVDYITYKKHLQQLTVSEIQKEAFGIFTHDYHNMLIARIEVSLTKNNVIKEGVRQLDSWILEYINDNQNWHDCKRKTENRKFGTNYYTLPTALRNNFHHPNNGYKFTKAELERSTLLLEEIVIYIKENY